MTRWQVSLVPEDATARLSEGIEVVLAAQARTGFPPPALWPPADLAVHTAQRQRDAHGVWTAEADARTVGHALIEPVPADHPDWSSLPAGPWQDALAAGRLAQLGALAVLPSHARQGIARDLVTARLRWAFQHRPDLLVVASIWTGSAGSASLAAAHAEPVADSPTVPGIVLVAYTRPSR